ncbi:substrate-binding domain-containing protein, partial [Deinococcus sp. S9]|uniref:substrate-binding domain-containing protein n=1 Tax=Deinococcus sp. S9 TaxID=2545754 RepID=UPI0010E26E0F
HGAGSHTLLPPFALLFCVLVDIPLNLSGTEAVANYLQRNPTVDGVMALGPVGAEPALQAINSIKRSVKLATFDLSSTVLNALRDGKMVFAVDQQQYLQGYLPVVLLANYKRYGLLPANDIIATGPGFVTSQNAAQVIDLTKRGIR